mgnify:CR=1 FL=1
MNEVIISQNEIIEEFSLLDNWEDRYQYIIDMGRNLPSFSDVEKTEENKIKGCQSQVWFLTKMQNERLKFRAISDAAIVSGLIAILLRIYSNKKPKDIIEAPIHFIEALGFEHHLSPTRSNGLSSMLKAIRNFAIEYE